MCIFFDKKSILSWQTNLHIYMIRGEGAGHLSNHLVRFPNLLAPGSDIQIHVSWGTRLQSPSVSQWVHNLHICVNLHRIRSRERTLFLLPGSPLVRNQKTSSLKKSKEGQAKCATAITPELSKTNWTNWFKEKKTVRSRWGSTKQAPLASLNQWEASIL